MKKSPAFACGAALMLTGFAANAASRYHLIKSIPITGDWTWGHIGIDSAHRHLLGERSRRIQASLTCHSFVTAKNLRIALKAKLSRHQLHAASRDPCRHGLACIVRRRFAIRQSRTRVSHRMTGSGVVAFLSIGVGAVKFLVAVFLNCSALFHMSSVILSSSLHAVRVT